MKDNIKAGDFVIYSDGHGTSEKGRVKSIDGEYAYVVYKCDGNWIAYRNYTGERSALDNLTKDNSETKLYSKLFG